METAYTFCAFLGGTLLVCQFLAGLLGLGHHSGIAGHDGHDLDHPDTHPESGHEVAHDTQMSWFLGVLTFRTMVAALTFFGLAGMAAAASALDPARTLVLALAAGGGALFLVAWLMRSLHRLQADGTVHIQRAVGRCGTVYLQIPGHRKGTGKVLLNVQNRTVEYQAVTAQEPLPTGAKITVLAVVDGSTVEVALAAPSERSTYV
jgi:hypothetical protein